MVSTWMGDCLGIPGAAGFGASLIAQSVKNLPAMQETQIQFLGWEDPLEKEMATHSSILAWKWTLLSDFIFTFTMCFIQPGILRDVLCI